MNRSLARPLGVAFAALAALVFAMVSAVPASASSMYFSRSSGAYLESSWLEVGTLPGGVPGNIHFGTMWVEGSGRGSAEAYGQVIDIQCEDGIIPDAPGGGHGEEGEEEPQLPEGCTHMGVRWIEGGDVNFTVDRKLARATLTGTLQVFGHEGAPSGTPGVNMTITGVGDVSETVESFRGTEGGTTYSYRYAASNRQGQTSGAIGAMVFDNADGEWSTATFGTFRQISRERTR